MTGGTLEGENVGRSHFCKEWEIRITERCLTDDLGLPADSDFQTASERSEFVRALVNQRCADPTGGVERNWLGPAPRDGQPGPAWLRHRHRERGITIFDPHRKIVWLAAYHAGHGSDEGDDPARAYFQELYESGSLAPSADDFDSLFYEEDLRVARLITVQGYLMLDRARETKQPVVDTLAGRLGTRVEVEYEPGIETLTVAFAPTEPRDYRIITTFLAAMYSDGWDSVEVMPSKRKISAPEVAYQHYHEA